MALALLKLSHLLTVKTLNPFNGPGSLKAERQQKRRGQFKIMVWTIVAANALLFTGLLIQGCRQEPAATETSGGTPPDAAAADTNAVAAPPAEPQTNSPVAAAPAAPPTNALPETAPAPAPTPAPTTATPYTVAKGDSFYKIAKANGVSMKALMAANPGVDSAKLKVGQVLQLPAGAAPSAAVAAAPTTTASAPASQPAASPGTAPARYVVKSGDTLSRIARAHGTSVSALKAANHLTGDRLVAGQRLKLPETKTAATAKAQS